MAIEAVQAASAVLSEARVLITEGEWGRGSMKRIVRVPKERQVLGFAGVEETREVVCYCVQGAIDEARYTIGMAADTADVDREMYMGYAARDLVEKALVEAATEMFAIQSRWMVVLASSRVVVQINDRLVSGKRQALEWIDKAIMKVGSGVGA